MKKLILIGGGHAHVEVLRRFGLDQPAAVDITLVSPDRHTPYSGMLPGLVAGHYTFEQCHIDLQPLARLAGARLVLTTARAMDAARRLVTLADGSKLAYDIASIDVGSVPLAQDVPGVAAHALPVKPVRGFLAAWDALQARAAGVRRVAVVGGGAAGVEMLLAMRYRLAQLKLPVLPGFALVTDTPQLLPQHPHYVRMTLQHALKRNGVAMYRGLRVTQVDADALTASDVHGHAQRIAADVVLWVTGAAPPAWLAGSGLALNDKKFININKYLQSSSDADVFAAGDCATIAGAVYPKSGVYAVRQGPVLAENLRRVLAGSASLQVYTPQERSLALISTGGRHAVASWGPFAFHGDWVWRWKDRIDRAFMARYQTA